MASISFTCPNCAKVLRASTRPPVGKRVKCPACGEPFLPQLDEDEAAIQEKPRIKAKVGAGARDPDDGPRGKKPRHDEDDDTDPDEPRGQRARDEDEDDDDRPKKKKKKVKQKTGSRMMLWVGVLVLGGGLALVSCAGCGIGGWYFYSATKGPELLAFVAPDANLLVGGNPKELKAKFAGFNDLAIQGAMRGPNPIPEIEDIMSNSDQFLMYLNTQNVNMGKNIFLVVKANQASIDKLKQNKNLGPAKMVDGHSIHTLANVGPARAAPQFVAFTGSHYVVFTDFDEPQLVIALNRSKKAPATSATIDLARSVGSSPGWMAFTFDAQARQSMKMLFNGAGEKIGAMRDAAPALDGAKGVTFTMDVSRNDDLNMTFSVLCRDSVDAAKVKAGVEEGYNQLKAALNLFMPAPAPGDPKAEAQKLMFNDLNTMKFATTGANATASMTFTKRTIEELAKVGGNNPFGPIAFQPQPFPQPQPQPKDFPPPQKDGKGFPKGPKIVTTPNFGVGQTKEVLCNFQKGNVQVHVHASSTPGTQVQMTILQGAAGENVIFTDNNAKQQVRITTFNCPAAGQYRVRIRNMGPGVVNSCALFIYE